MDLIIGAGITGLSYALLKGDSDYLILETENEIGGYCRTIIAEKRTLFDEFLRKSFFIKLNLKLILSNFYSIKYIY